MFSLPPIKALHHAYIVVGDPHTSSRLLDEYFKKNDISTTGNVDFITISEKTFTIDQARALKHDQSQKAETSHRIFMIITETMTREVQNALLKIFEEPTTGTYFFVLLPDDQTILATLRSRIHLIQNNEKHTRKEKINALEFLALLPSERIDMVKKLTDKKTPEEEKITKQEAIHLLNQIEEELSKNLSLKSHFDVFQELRQTRTYLKDKGSSLKMLLEHISLLV